ncbi:kinase-like domain-containing protein [Mycena vulgaris]|nr:kinase-like domain-containing protein [Mycena vulgaris]
MAAAASDKMVLSAKRECDKALQKLITHVASSSDNVRSMNRRHSLEISGLSPGRGVPEPTESINSSPHDHITSGEGLTCCLPAPALDYFDSLFALDLPELILREIVTVVTEIINAPVERFLTQPASAQYFMKKLRAIGKTWEFNPEWFSRVVKWYQADQHPEYLLGNDAEESWSFFLSKSSRWYYKDPKGKIHGPWKTSLMDSWQKDDLLPPDLPVRKEEDSEYVLLRDLRLKSAHPSHPFRQSVVDDAAAPKSIKDFDIIKTLHKGDGPKSVFLAKRISTGASFAVKVVEKTYMFAKNKVTIIHAERMAVLNQADSQFVVKLHFAFESKTGAPFAGDSNIFISRELSIGTRISERDLRPGNILIDHGNRLKLADFGITQKAFLARNIGRDLGQMDDKSAAKQFLSDKEFLTSVYYLSPEAVLGVQDDDASIDWWAFGIITYEFLYGVTPFQDDELELVFHRILSGWIDWNRSSSFSPSIVACDFISGLLDPDAAVSRCSFRGADGVKTHSFFDDIRRHSRTAATDSVAHGSPPSGASQKYLPNSPNHASSRNSSDGRGSSWLSGYTTTDSETDESSIVSRFPSPPSSPEEWNVPGYNLPSHQLLLKDLASLKFLLPLSCF